MFICYEVVNLFCLVYMVPTPTRNGVLSLVYQLLIYSLTRTHHGYQSMTASNKDRIEKLKATLQEVRDGI